MAKTNKMIAIIVIIAIILIGIGYAAIENITLRISGTAEGEPSQDNFTVAFSGIPTVSNEEKAQAAVTNDTNATFNVTGLTAKGDTVTATYTIQNTSEDLSAKLSANVTNSNTEYFNVTYSFESENLTKGAATAVTVTVELIKTPITESVSSRIGVQISAEPVQPQ